MQSNAISGSIEETIHAKMLLELEIEPKSPALQANVLTLTLQMLVDVTSLHTPTCLSGALLEMSVQTTT